MNRKKFVTFLFIILILCSINTIATTYMKTDFEAPTYSIGNLSGQDSWTGTNTEYIDIVGGQWVEMSDPGSSALSNTKPFDSQADGLFQFSFDLKFNGETCTGANCNGVFLCENSACSYSYGVFYIYCDPNDDLRNAWPGGSDPVIATDGCLETDWINIHGEINEVTDTIDLWYNDTQVGDDWGMRSGGDDWSYGRVSAHQDAGSLVFSVDNLCVADDITTECFTPTDTCSYIGSGDWDMSCDDNCNITTDYDLGGNDFTINGTGNVTINASITNFTNFNIWGNDGVNTCNVFWQTW